MDFNVGAYKADFAPGQILYEKAVHFVYQSIDQLKATLIKHSQPRILRNQLVELDFKAFVTLVRFDTAYAQIFKLKWKILRHNYPHLYRLLKNLYWNVVGSRQTTNFKHTKEAYFKCMTHINPKAIVHFGPQPYLMPWMKTHEKWRQSWKKN